jgi:hypothetical protein
MPDRGTNEHWSGAAQRYFQTNETSRALYLEFAHTKNFPARMSFKGVISGGNYGNMKPANDLPPGINPS